jgi:hypothetical protein
MSATDSESIFAAHQLYCQLTGQSLRLGFDRERQWYEWLRAGFTLQDLRRLIAYMQREIREGRRNVGALKISNLLQLERFEEDILISRVRLRPAPATKPLPAPVPDDELERRRQRVVQGLRILRDNLR